MNAINCQNLIHLSECWNETTKGELDLDCIEACIHEMAHVLDITGDVVHHDRSTDDIISELPTTTSQDFNEIRASAVTRWALICLGILTWKSEKDLIDGMKFNIEYPKIYNRWWGEMRDSKKSWKMGKHLADLIVAMEVVT